jgi:lipoate-protein ligase A
MPQDWQWRFGETPEFTHHVETRFDWGQMELNFDAQDGVIRTCKIYSDCLHPQLITELEAAFQNANYDQYARAPPS